MHTRIAVSLAAGAAALALALTACASGDSTGASSTAVQGSAVAATTPAAPQRVDAATFAGVITTPGVTVIDVRTPAEYSAGHIKDAVNIDVEGADFATRIAALDPAGIYAVYCRSGNRSKTAVASMQQAGINGIYELEGGITGWQAAGLPVGQ